MCVNRIIKICNETGAKVLTMYSGHNITEEEYDKAVNKKTTVVIFGRKTMGRVYCISGIVAMLVMIPVWTKLNKSQK